MKLRWKYFFILLTASLIPLLIVTGISQKVSQLRASKFFIGTGCRSYGG